MKDVYVKKLFQNRNTKKSKSVFPNDDALLKMLCRAQVNITKSGQVRLAAGTLYGAIEILLMKKMDTVFVPGRFEK